MADDDRRTIRSGPWSATIDAQGAELCALSHAAHGELIWRGDQPWPRHSPVLFPIVGRLKDDTLTLDGRPHRMTQHGFARDRRFGWTHRAADACALTLEDDDTTRAAYPFPFRLRLDYALDAGGLRVGYRLTNTGDGSLPASLGAHPAFNWPLAEGVAPEDHRLEFAQDEPEPVRRLNAGGLLKSQPQASPVRGRTLPLDPALFDADALIFDRPRSRALSYVAGGALALEIGWEGFTELGVWSKRPNGFLCIEPWRGFASPERFDGDFRAKPGLMHLAPGEARELSWRVGIAAAA